MRLHTEAFARYLHLQSDAAVSFEGAVVVGDG